MPETNPRTIAPKRSAAAGLALLLALSSAAALEAKKRKKFVEPTLYQGVAVEEAMEALMAEAQAVLKKGTWETINFARNYYLSGRKDEARTLLAPVIAKADASDWIRMGRVYYDAGDWEEAREAFEKVVAMAPEDEDWLAEIGAYYNLEGDRARAEELFARSFELEPDDGYNMLKAAGSYVGVEPR